jgi:hypothetical protein
LSAQLLPFVWAEPGRAFRLPARFYADVSANLSIANMDFAEFAEAADATGTYRGFTDAGGAGERPAS